LFGKGIRWNSFDSICRAEACPHLRPLLALVVPYDCPSFEFMADRVNKTFLALDACSRFADPDYRVLRSRLLDIESLCLNYPYFPPEPLDVQLGDIGYIRNDKFIKLTDRRQELKIVQKSIDPYITASGDHTSMDLGNGVVRHTFKSPLYAKIARFSPPRFAESRHWWPYFIKEAPKILAEFKDEHGISLSDLILVGGIWEDRRDASFEFLVDGTSTTDSPPEEIYFDEYVSQNYANPWGEWVAPAPNPNFKTNVMRTRQRISFAQLEEDDCVL